MERLTNLDAISWPQTVAGLAALAVLAVVVWLTKKLISATYSAVKDAGMRRIAVTIAAAIGLGASVESSWIFAGAILHWSGVWQAIPAVLFETALIAIATCVMEEIEESDGKPEIYLPWFWGLVALASITMALAGTNAASVIGRAAIPIVPSIIWYATVVLPKLRRRTGDGNERQAVTWLLSLRRIGIWLRIIKPGDDDLQQLPVEYLTRRIVRTAFRASRLRRYTDARLVGWVAAIRLGRAEVRAQRLALLADEPIMIEAENRIERSVNAATRLDPTNIEKRRKQQQEAALEAAWKQEAEARQEATEAAARICFLEAALADVEAAAEAARERAEEAALEAFQQQTRTIAELEQEAAARVTAEAEAVQLKHLLERLRVDGDASGTKQSARGRKRAGSTPRVAPETVARVASELARTPRPSNTEIAASLGISPKQVGNAVAVLRQQEAAAGSTAGGNVRTLHTPRETADEERPQRAGVGA